MLKLNSLVRAKEFHSPGRHRSRPCNAIIVGGSSGMGKAAALQVLQHGGKVLLVSRSLPKLERAKQELVQQVTNAKVDLYPLDCTDECAVQSFAEQLENDTWDGLVGHRMDLSLN
jgi:short-subunit dehydrogenase